jgi:N-acyl-D-amino-acid deacylase
MKKISRRQFIERSAKTGLAVGILSPFSGKSIFSSVNRFDLIIKDVEIVDGMNQEPYQADIGIVSDFITAIGELSEASSKLVIDGKGKVAAPGFIDIHSHTDTELLINPKAESKIRQGVTTELGGNCAHSPFPRKTPRSPQYEGMEKDLSARFNWTDLEGYHSAMEKNGIANNHATLVGQGTIRHYVMDDDPSKPTSQQMEAQKKLVREAMRQGAFGLSTGLEYIPSRFADTDELIELCKVVAEYGGIYATHTRSEDVNLMEAVAEAIHIAESAGLPLQISHLKAAGQSNYYKIPLVFDLLERTKDRGLEVTADRYPYRAYSTTLNIMFPRWAVAGGSEKFVERLKDKDLRQKMKEEALEKTEGNNGYSSMLITHVNNEKNSHLVGKYIQEAADEANKDAYEFACDLLISEGGSLSITGFGMGEENTEKVLKHPLVMLCSDGSAIAPYGPLNREMPHPRNYGAFPRFLRLYMREKKIVTLPEAIHKMAAMPAKKLGLNKRGVIEKGNYADIVIFDKDEIADRATYLKPKVYPVGIDYVLVNGKVVVDHGEHTGVLSGMVLHGPGKK